MQSWRIKSALIPCVTLDWSLKNGCKNVDGKTAFPPCCKDKQKSWHLLWNVFLCVENWKEKNPHGCRNLPRPVGRLAGLVWRYIWALRWHISSHLYLTHWTPHSPMFPISLEKAANENGEKQAEVRCNYTEWILPPTFFHCANCLRDNEMEGTLFFLNSIYHKSC